jgi:S-adenosylmethionine synthetase
MDGNRLKRMQIRMEGHRIAPPGAIEIVERKGLGHPDTICDHVSEKFSVALSKHYLEQFGLVLHHNVDKALLVGGEAEPRFGGGRILKPVELYLSGRATAEFQGRAVPIADIARDAAQSWFMENLHAFDVARGLKVHCLTKAGSPDLVDLFRRQRASGRFLANDTSIGAGFAPLSALERMVLAVEQHMNAPAFKTAHPEAGEDVKVMGLREGERFSLIVSCAFVGRYLADIAAYRDAVEAVRAAASGLASGIASAPVDVRVNAADDIAAGSVYLTVGGTSAECGDDGETGRGNRTNGLITPFRPMTLEAAAGKNPITHVGKLYNAAARRMADRLVAEIPELASCATFLVSQIGAPVDEPRSVYVRYEAQGGALSGAATALASDIAKDEVKRIPDLWEAFLRSEVGYV